MEQHKNYTKLAIKPEATITLFVADQAVATPKKLVEINCGVIIDLVKCETNTMKYLLLWVIDMQHAARLPSWMFLRENRQQRALLIEREFMTSFINVHAKVKISNKVNSKKNMIRINLYELTTFVIGVNKYARVYEII